MYEIVTQPNYIPWKGYFDLIAKADKFVLDDVQYTNRDWRNRNLIKASKTIWLNIPIIKKIKFIKDVLIKDFNWSDT